MIFPNRQAVCRAGKKSIFGFALELVQLAFQRIDGLVDGLLEALRLIAGYQVVTRHVQRDRSDFIALSGSLSSLRMTSAPVERSAKRSNFAILAFTNSTNRLSASNFTD